MVRPLQRHQWRLLHLVEQLGWNSATAHLDTLRLDPEYPVGGDGLQGHGDVVFKLLRGGLTRLTQPPETAAPMMGQPLQIQHLGPGSAKGMEHLRFAAAGVTTEEDNGARLGQSLAQPPPTARPVRRV